MIILGKNKDDVGTQLERLTKRLLESRGYKKVVTNIIGEGGNEVDVQAEFPNPMPQNPHSRRLIAECKAWANPISLPDWLKFLGKVFVEEAKLGNEVDGLYVSLSGVNGPVAGNYDSLRQRKQHIILLEGEALTNEITPLYALPAPKAMAEALARFTEKQYSSMELAYYDEKFYWVFTFQGGDIAVLAGDGNPADPSLLSQIQTALLDRTQGKRVLDLSAEQHAKERRRDCNKFLLAALFTQKGGLPKGWAEQAQNGFTPEELQTALADCVSRGWVVADSSGNHAPAFAPNQREDIFVDVLRFMLLDGITLRDWQALTDSELFKDMLQHGFVPQVSAIQGKLPLEDETLKKKIIFLVSASPSALAYSLHPDPLIVTHRLKQPEVKYNEAHDVSVFMRNLLRGFRFDFKLPGLSHFFLKTRGLRELDIAERYKIKDGKEVVLEHEVRQRSLIGEAAESLGGGLIHLEALPEAPEPWNLFSKPQPQS